MVRLTANPVLRNAARSLSSATQPGSGRRAQPAAGARRPKAPGADGGPLHIVVDHAPADHQVVGVGREPVPPVVPVAADRLGGTDPVATAVPPDPGERAG